MSLEDAAAALGIELDEVSTEQKLKTEKRYCFIVHVLRGKKAFMGATPEPVTNIKKARRQALKHLFGQVKTMKKNDIVSFKCMEFVYSDVPIDTIVRGVIYKMQPVSNRWMTPEEIEVNLK
jgi:hypothetical protein